MQRLTWRERRRYANLFHVYDDIGLEYKEVEQTKEEIIKQVISFFKSGSELIYPAKSFFVAIIYAKMLEKYFSVPFWDGLNMNDLLTDDKWYEPYSKQKDVYDGIVKSLPSNFLELESCAKTKAYFMEEFLIGIDC